MGIKIIEVTLEDGSTIHFNETELINFYAEYRKTNGTETHSVIVLGDKCIHRVQETCAQIDTKLI